jgi:hypothetical protein
MAHWEKHTLRLDEDHAWKARPGYNIFVADRGAVKFEFPEDWVVLPGEDSIKFHDRQPPDDDCTLQISVFHLPPEVDWSGLALGPLLGELVGKDTRDVLGRSEVVEVRRPGLDLAWTEVHFLDPNEKREAYSRTCLARSGTIQPLITFDFWADDAPRCRPIWDAVLDSLRLGMVITDPTRGDMRPRNN